MIFPITNFKARLIETPKIKKDPDDPKSELIKFGEFTVNKKYPVYSIYSSATATQFMVVDDTGQFYWLSTGVFRK